MGASLLLGGYIVGEEEILACSRLYHMGDRAFTSIQKHCTAGRPPGWFLLGHLAAELHFICFLIPLGACI